MIKKSISYIGISFLNFLSLLPLPLLYILATLSHYFIFYIIRYRRKIVAENLKNSFPEKNTQELHTIEKKYYQYLADLIFEVIKMPRVPRNELEKRYRFNNLDLLETHFRNNQSILICSGHYGNWEWGMLALGYQVSAKAYGIFKPVNNKHFDDWFYHARTRYGNQMVTMRQTLRAVAGTKNDLTMFCFAGDQTPVKHEARQWIKFLHQPTPVLTGMEKIAHQTGRPVYYLKVTYIKRGYYEVDCVPVSETPALTRPLEITKKTFDILEHSIRQAPPYWLWSHRRWKHKPEHEAWNQA